MSKRCPFTMQEMLFRQSKEALFIIDDLTIDLNRIFYSFTFPFCGR